MSDDTLFQIILIAALGFAGFLVMLAVGSIL